MQRTPFALVLALAASLFLAHACSGKRPVGGDDPVIDAGPDGGTDAGHDSGVIEQTDAGCTTDALCGVSRWCEKATGECRDAKPCPQGQSNCDAPDYAPYCENSQCYCDPEDKGCKPIHAACSPCDQNAQCGNDRLAYDYPADCVADGGTKLCLPRRDGTMGCPPGYSTPATGNYCVPAGGYCGGQGACTTDAQCDPHSTKPICNPQLGLCVGACTFDLKTGDSTCPTGQVCHQIPTLATLPPQDANFGKGRCGPPCTQATACGSGLVCRTEGVQHPVQRCGLPPPACMGDIECPDSPQTNSWGYCELAAHQCKTDCRTGADCHGGFICSANQCVAATCLQAGGAALSCDYGQFCCGEAESPAACAAGADAGACYDKPAPTWCATCSADADCRTAAYPSRAGKPNLCLSISQNQKVCAMGCDPGHPAECPRSWGCQSIFAGCDQASDCGNQAGARCDKPDGGSGICGCASDAECPQSTTCKNSQCVISSVCKPACP